MFAKRLSVWFTLRAVNEVVIGQVQHPTGADAGLHGGVVGVLLWTVLRRGADEA